MLEKTYRMIINKEKKGYHVYIPDFGVESTTESLKNAVKVGKSMIKRMIKHYNFYGISFPKPCSRDYMSGDYNIVIPV
ncbi:hypothetical protein [Peptostreptococcus faecalis]|uniref:hypothetical protein n=1 Tax=Peptostreptococcus faecalis TaxID=2045015 RepID=UPI000C7D825D|nr:hypothetical protein [Peptostreptococcus faecalis]